MIVGTLGDITVLPHWETRSPVSLFKSAGAELTSPYAIVVIVNNKLGDYKYKFHKLLGLTWLGFKCLAFHTGS